MDKCEKHVPDMASTPYTPARQRKAGIIMDADRLPSSARDRRGAGDISPEKTLWVVHPSPVALAPEILISILLIVFLFPRAVPAVQYAVDASHAWIPWTQASVDAFLMWFRIAIFLPAAITALRAIALRFTRYELTTQRLRVCRGILVRKHDEIGLHRIRDYKVRRPILGLFLGYGAIRIISRDPSMPVLDMTLVPDAQGRYEQIRQQSQIWKNETGYREFDTGALS